MKRKKFVKQIMSTGIDRNTAEHMAQICRGCREPYANGLRRHKHNLQQRPQWWAYDFLCGLPGGGGNE